MLSLLLFTLSIAVHGQVPEYRVEIIKTLPHNLHSFTQGFICYQDNFYESSGLYGKSFLQQASIEDGTILKQTPVDTKLFAEGIARVGQQLTLLSWKAGYALIFDLNTLSLIKKIPYQHTSQRRDRQLQGWGLTFDGQHLILSDGSDYLHYLDPKTLKPIRKMQVTLNGQPIYQLNELEFVEGEIFANIWQKNRILRINPEGIVTGIIHMHTVIKAAKKFGHEEVLNGIAYDKKNQRLFVTGKRWPYIFEVRLVKEPTP